MNNRDRLTIAVNICAKNPCQYVKRAMNQSLDRVLSVLEFVKASGYKVNPLFYSEKWQIELKQDLIHISRSWLSFLGFPDPLPLATRNFQKVLRQLDLPFKEITLTNSNLKIFPSIGKDARTLMRSIRYQHRFILMSKRQVKILGLSLDNEMGDLIREYYKDVVKVFTKYNLYRILRQKCLY